MLELSTEQEHSWKLNVVAQLHSGLGFHGTEPRLIASAQRTEYRNRIRLRVDERGRIVFFNSEKSPSCAVLMQELREYVNHLRTWSESHPRALAACAHLEARTCDEDGRFGLFLTARPESEIFVAVLEELAGGYADQTITTNTAGSDCSQRFTIDAATYQRVPLHGFLQVNFHVNRLLTEHVVSEARARGHQSFADLYCGSGNFALPLARAGLSGLAAERVVSSVRCAQAAAHEQGLRNVRFQHGDAIELAAGWSNSESKVDLVIVDPPRAGVRVGLETIADLACKSIAYCSCNPETLERDVSFLKTMGWDVEQVTAFDMFPGTRHLEVVAWLSR